MFGANDAPRMPSIQLLSDLPPKISEAENFHVWFKNRKINHSHSFQRSSRALVHKEFYVTASSSFHQDINALYIILTDRKPTNIRNSRLLSARSLLSSFHCAIVSYRMHNYHWPHSQGSQRHGRLDPGLGCRRYHSLRVCFIIFSVGPAFSVPRVSPVLIIVARIHTNISDLFIFFTSNWVFLCQGIRFAPFSHSVSLIPKF